VIKLLLGEPGFICQREGMDVDTNVDLTDAEEAANAEARGKKDVV